MKIILRTLLALTLAVLLAHHAAHGANTTPPKSKPLTMLVYIAADNDLAPGALYNLAQMKAVGSSPYVNILVHLNIRTSNGTKVTRKLFINRGGVTQIGPDEARDSGVGATLLDACIWALTDYPSDQFVLILWNHGSGPLNRFNTLESLEQHHYWWSQDICNERGVCYDDTTGHYLNDIALQNVFSAVVNKYRNGKKINIIAFDACLMGGIEVADLVAPYAQYLVASQQTVPGLGFNYTALLTPPSKGAMTDKELASLFVKTYEQEYKTKIRDYTLSAIDTTRATATVDAVNTLATYLIQALRSSDGQMLRMAIQKAARYNITFEEHSYVDLVTFYKNLSTIIKVVPFTDTLLKNKILTLLATSVNTLTQSVVASVAGPYYKGVGGLSIYFPINGVIDASYPKLLWSQKNAWTAFLAELYPAQ